MEIFKEESFLGVIITCCINYSPSLTSPNGNFIYIYLLIELNVTEWFILS